MQLTTLRRMSAKKTPAPPDPSAPAAPAPAGPRLCTIADSLQIVGDRWSLLAIREMVYEVNRFDQITAQTGMARNILTDRLRALQASGIVERRQYSERPPRFEYHLTVAGLELAPVLLALSQWGDKWTRDEPTLSFEHSCGRPLLVDQLCHECHEPVVVGSVRIR